MPKEKVRQVVLCTGKIYYELDAHRREINAKDVALIRLEQLYPLRRELLEKTLAPYREGTPVLWVQEEPRNMGAWIFMRMQFGEKLFGRFPFSAITRPASASPATGSARRHKQEQTKILEKAFSKD